MAMAMHATVGSAKSVISFPCKHALLNFVLSCREQRIYRIPEEQSPGTIVANITAKDPDDEDSPSRLFYSIQSSDRYFSINPCKTNKNVPSDTPKKRVATLEKMFLP